MAIEKHSLGELPARRDGQPPLLVTFYSFKGGVGRTQALYNVAVRLAALRRRVLMVDVDLEAPGLSIGVLRDERRRQERDGFAEIASDLLLDLGPAVEDEDPDYQRLFFDEYRDRMTRALHPVEPPMPSRGGALLERLREHFDFTAGEGALALLSTGRVGSQYVRTMSRLPLSQAFRQTFDDDGQARVRALLDRLDVRLAFEDAVVPSQGHLFTILFRALLQRATVPETDRPFDYVLLDSRSGLADVGGLCLRGLPDLRVVLTGLNRQNLTGTEMVLNTLSDEERHGDRLIVVFSPVPEGELDLLEQRVKHATRLLKLGKGGGDGEHSDVRMLHYHPRIALEEDPFLQPAHRYARIYDEYEALTDHVLELTGADADALLTEATVTFRDADEPVPERAVRLLTHAAVADPDAVSTYLEGRCTQIYHSGSTDVDHLVLFELWAAVDPTDVAANGTAALFCHRLGMALWNKEPVRAERLFYRAFSLYGSITAAHPREGRTWYNWGVALRDLAERAWESDRERGEALFASALEKYERAVDLNPDDHRWWGNWGYALRGLAERVWESNRERGEVLFTSSFEKYERAVEVKPDYHWVWNSWGLALQKLAKRLWKEDRSRADAIFASSIETYDRAVAIRPDYDLAWYNLGNAHRNVAERMWTSGERREALDRYVSAWVALHQAAEVSEDPRYWYVLHSVISGVAQRLGTLQEGERRSLLEMAEARLAEESKAILVSVLWLHTAMTLAATDGEAAVVEAEEYLRPALYERPELVEVAQQDEDVMQHPRLAAIVEEARAAAGEGEEVPEEAEAP